MHEKAVHRAGVRTSPCGDGRLYLYLSRLGAGAVAAVGAVLTLTQVLEDSAGRATGGGAHGDA